MTGERPPLCRSDRLEPRTRTAAAGTGVRLARPSGTVDRLSRLDVPGALAAPFRPAGAPAADSARPGARWREGTRR